MTSPQIWLTEISDPGKNYNRPLFCVKKTKQEISIWPALNLVSSMIGPDQAG